MNQYPKNILSIEEQIAAYKSAGMIIPDEQEVEDALKNIGYYRLRGYCFHFYDNAAKKYKEGTNFSNVLKLYNFDKELSHLLFSFTCSIEVSLRSRLIEALLIHEDALILMDPTFFSDKERYWKNLGVISSEISRSNDVFIKHNYNKHDGEIPIWAAVEVISFGTLSKLIKNLKTGADSSFSRLADSYSFKTSNGKTAKPSKNMFTSWIQAVSVLRNLCAHNSRIYNRAISTTPELLINDQINPRPKYNGLYQIVLSMKYLRPNDIAWKQFTDELKSLIVKYDGVFEYARMNFPKDWEKRLEI